MKKFTITEIDVRDHEKFNNIMSINHDNLELNDNGEISGAIKVVRVDGQFFTFTGDNINPNRFLNGSGFIIKCHHTNFIS
jgi:hypothetical protein